MKSKAVLRTQKMQNKILRAAILLISKQGFGNTRMIDIARKSRTTPPTVYSYFSSKKEVLFAIFEEGLAQLNAELERDMVNLENSKSFWDRFNVFFNDVIRFIKSHPHISILIVREFFRMDYTLRIRVLTRIRQYRLLRELFICAWKAYGKLKSDSTQEGSKEMRAKISQELLSLTLMVIAHAWGVESPQEVIKYLNLPGHRLNLSV